MNMLSGYFQNPYEIQQLQPQQMQQQQQQQQMYPTIAQAPITIPIPTFFEPQQQQQQPQPQQLTAQMQQQQSQPYQAMYEQSAVATTAAAVPYQYQTPFDQQFQYQTTTATYQPTQVTQYPYQQQQQTQQYFQSLPAIQYQPSTQTTQYYQPNNFYYEKNDMAYPDASGFTVYPTEMLMNDMQAPYNSMFRNAQMTTMPYMTDYSTYDPYRKHQIPSFPTTAANGHVTTTTPPCANTTPAATREASTEEILKKNPQLWSLYQTGRFDIVQTFDSKEKKIILKERTDMPDTKYTVKKFKVPVSTAHGSDDGQVLLVSFSNSQLDSHHHTNVTTNTTNTAPSQGVNDTTTTNYAYDDTVVTATNTANTTVTSTTKQHKVKKIKSNESLGMTYYSTEEQKIVGPGSGLVARLIECGSSYSQSGIFEEDEEVVEEEDEAEEVVEEEEETEVVVPATITSVVQSSSSNCKRHTKRGSRSSKNGKY